MRHERSRGDHPRGRRCGVHPEAADTTDPAAAKSLIDRIAGEIGPPDALVNTIGAPQVLDTPTNRATFPTEVMTHTVAPEAIAGVIAFLISDAAAPVSGATLPAYGA